MRNQEGLQDVGLWRCIYVFLPWAAGLGRLQDARRTSVPSQRKQGELLSFLVWDKEEGESFFLKIGMGVRLYSGSNSEPEQGWEVGVGRNPEGRITLENLNCSLWLMDSPRRWRRGVLMALDLACFPHPREVSWVTPQSPMPWLLLRTMNEDCSGESRTLQRSNRNLWAVRCPGRGGVWSWVWGSFSPAPSLSQNPSRKEGGSRDWGSYAAGEEGRSCG